MVGQALHGGCAFKELPLQSLMLVCGPAEHPDYAVLGLVGHDRNSTALIGTTKESVPVARTDTAVPLRDGST